mgnify:CR=1 FL=1
MGDGSKALLLVNEGTVPEPDFKVEHVFSQKNLVIGVMVFQKIVILLIFL